MVTLAQWYKRLEEGVFKMPRIDGDAKSVELRASELAMMLDGIDLAHPMQRVINDIPRKS